MKRPTELLILAGGLGARLREIVPDLPKPLAPVAGRPFLSFLLENWLEQGIRSLTFLLRYKAQLIEAFLAEEQQTGLLKECKVRIAIEPQALNTGGAVAYAIRQHRISGSFLVANGDTWLATGIKAISGTKFPSLGVVHVDDSQRYGAVQLEGDRVVAFKEKQDSGEPGWINTGLYHLCGTTFDHWNGEPFSLETDLFPRLAKAGQLRAVRIESEFLDIGVPRDYLRFCRWADSDKAAAL